jgi:hypothetical protein
MSPRESSDSPEESSLQSSILMRTKKLNTQKGSLKSLSTAKKKISNSRLMGTLRNADRGSGRHQPLVTDAPVDANSQNASSSSNNSVLSGSGSPTLPNWSKPSQSQPSSSTNKLLVRYRSEREVKPAFAPSGSDETLLSSSPSGGSSPGGADWRYHLRDAWSEEIVQMEDKKQNWFTVKLRNDPSPKENAKAQKKKERQLARVMKQKKEFDKRKLEVSFND